MFLYLRNFLILFILIGIYAVTNNSLRNYRFLSSSTQVNSTTIWTLPPLAIKALAGEFKGIVADLILLEAGAQLGTQVVRTSEGKRKVIKKEYNWPTIHRLFTNSQALDPSFQQTYLLAQGWLPWDAKQYDETFEILETAKENRPWDWRPAHLMGFNYYYFLNQPGEAGKIFLDEVKTNPNAPTFLAILGARLAHKGGGSEAALALMQSMLEDKEETDSGYQDMAERLHALKGAVILERAVLRYNDAIGKKPDELSDLVSAGIISSIPANPYNLPYCLDHDGNIHFDNPKCRHSN